MKTRFLSLFILLTLMVSSCGHDEMLGNRYQSMLQDKTEFAASFENTNDSRTYIEEDAQTSRLYLRWTKADEISIFRGTTLNQRFQFSGETGDNSGSFKPVPNDDFVSSNELDESRNYAFYPYDENTKITEKGVFAVTMPATQKYAENSFGLGANSMVAVTETKGDVDLKFKNVGGYFKFKFYSDNLTIKSVSLQGNNGEKLAGKAQIVSGYEVTPAITMSEEATEVLTLDCGSGVKVGTTQEEATEFWFVLPPTKFSKGFTITITNMRGGTYTRTTEKVFEIKRNTIKPISAIHIDEWADYDYEAILVKERAALINLYNATNGDDWINNTNWCSDKPVSEWYGVKADSNGRIWSLDLSYNRLIGSIPESIGDLNLLSHLELGNNQLKGNLPDRLGELQSLGNLWMSDNQLTGDVSILNLMPNLSSIMLERNQFTGKLPDMPQDPIRFTMNDNLFTGSIPEKHVKALGNRTEYGFDYDVHNNNLSGIVPACMTSHKNWHIHWFNVLLQNPGYGFEKVDIPAHANIVKCYDDTYLDLGEEYEKNKYTLIFRANPDCPYSAPYINQISQLYDKYKGQGLGLVCTTMSKYSTDEVEEFFSPMSDSKVFWETAAGQGNADMSYENNPYGLNKYFFLFRFGLTPYFQVVDNAGKIIFFGSLGDMGTLPQHHANRDEIFDFVANLFGDETFEPENYTSTDYSRDGEVVTLQTATAGQGINLVFMGEAFVDKDMESGGFYEQKMKEAMEKFFSIEPYKSMRNRFNVYAVKVVSPNDYFGASSKHQINENNGICFEYATKIPGADQQPFRVSVIYNTSGSVGRSYTAMYSDGSFVGYMMEGINDVLLHEAGGHGFANLMDEYVEPGNENLTLPETDKNDMDELWSSRQGGANVDWRNDEATVKWAHFLNDGRYANEGLGLYEGAYLYGHGAYRPTVNSMMRYNDAPFNAPSREQIYKRIMQCSESETWEYDYEEFVKFDEKSRRTESRSTIKPLTEAEQKDYIKNHRPPIIIKGTWRDAMKGKSKVVVPLR